MLGLHWIADASGCAPERLTRESCRRALVELPERLGLTRVGEPQLFEHGCGDGDATVAGIVLLAESHVSVHAFPGERSVHVDVFSCRPMSTARARDYVAEFFAAEGVRDWTVERGSSPSSPDE